MTSPAGTIATPTNNRSPISAVERLKQGQPKQEQPTHLLARLPAQARVQAKAEFDQVFAQGRRYAHPLLALHLLRKPSGGAKLGLAVSRKVDPRAVARNRIKRVLREQFRLRRAQLPPGAYVVVARRAARTAEHSGLRAALITLLQRAGALPLSPSTGTMPPPDSGAG